MVGKQAEASSGKKGRQPSDTTGGDRRTGGRRTGKPERRNSVT